MALAIAATLCAARTQLEADPHAPRYIVTVHGSGYQLLTWPGEMH